MTSHSDSELEYFLAAVSGKETAASYTGRWQKQSVRTKIKMALLSRM